MTDVQSEKLPITPCLVSLGKYFVVCFQLSFHVSLHIFVVV